MRRLHIIMVLTTVLLLLTPGMSSAQEQSVPGVSDFASVNLLSWFFTNPRDWILGAVLFVSGFVGALTFTYGLGVGSKLPGMAPQAQLDIDRQRLAAWWEYLDEMRTADKPDWVGIDKVNGVVNGLRDDLDRINWRLYLVAAPLYVFLGGMFAILLAQDVLQAFVIGAGWTGFTGLLGLQKDNNKRNTYQNDALEKAKGRAKSLKSSLEEIPDKQKFQATRPDVAAKIDRATRELDGLARDISAAKEV